jgi:hypothetical protein
LRRRTTRTHTSTSTIATIASTCSFSGYPSVRVDFFIVVIVFIVVHGYIHPRLPPTTTAPAAAAASPRALPAPLVLLFVLFALHSKGRFVIVVKRHGVFHVFNVPQVLQCLDRVD